MRRNIGGLVVGLIILVAGLGIVGASVQSLVHGASSDVKCHNEVMNPGDSCEVTTNGHSSYQSYDELKNAKKSIVAPVAGIVFGSLLLLWGGFILWGAYRAPRE